MIGKLRAYNEAAGGMDSMRAQRSYTGDELNSTVPIREQNLGELEDAVSQHLASLQRRACRYVGNPYDAEDAVQDALLSAYTHLDQFKGTARITTWLTAIVTNCALTQLRRRPRQPHVSLDDRLDEEGDYCLSDKLADAKPSPEVECMNVELHGHLMQSLAELSPSQRKVIQLRHLDGLTTGEAAQILGVAEGTVKAQVSRARSRLRKMALGV
jgi:RNA polymerase sigma-70 factor (ECF subfamily)